MLDASAGASDRNAGSSVVGRCSPTSPSRSTAPNQISAQALAQAHPWPLHQSTTLLLKTADFVAESHLARFVLSVVRDEVDLCKITCTYGSELGQPPFNPIMMTGTLFFVSKINAIIFA